MSRLSHEEQVLVQGCRAGHEAAWLALYRAYATDIGRYLKGMLRHPADVDDLVQKVFLEFLSSLGRYRGDAGLRTWLHRIAQHVALHDIRSRERRDRHVRAYAETVETEGPCPEARLVARDRLQQLQELLLQLDDGFREVWVLRELQGFSVAEAAEVLEIPPATVRTRHYRARRRLLVLIEAVDAREGAGPRLAWTRGGDP